MIDSQSCKFTANHVRPLRGRCGCLTIISTNMRPFQGRAVQPFLLIMRTLQGRAVQPFWTYYANPSGSNYTTIFNLLCEPFRV